MAYLTIIRMPGDPDGLLTYKREVMDPVMQRVAPEFGLISHAFARTGDGAIVVNVWRSREGSEAVAHHPEVVAALEGRASAAGAPTFEHYELDDLAMPDAAVPPQ